MPNLRRNERSWRTDRGPLSAKLAKEFNRAVQGGTASSETGYTAIAFGLLSASSNFVSKSFNHTFASVGAVTPWAVPITTASQTVAVASVSTTFVIFTTSGAGTQFYAGVFGR